MPVTKLPLVGSLINSSATNTTTTQEQNFLNCFPEVYRNPITGSGGYHLVKRTGFVTSGVSSSLTGTVAVSGRLIWSGNAGQMLLCSQTTNTLYVDAYTLTTPSTITATVVGTSVTTNAAAISTGSGASNGPTVYLSETLLSNVPYVMCLVVDAGTTIPEGYFYTPSMGAVAWTNISSANFPANLPKTIVGNAVHLNGFCFVMTSDGFIYNSDLNSLANWTANAYLAAQLFPDGGLGLSQSKNLLIGFGTNSTEFFQLVDNPTGSPLQRIPSASSQIGLVSMLGNLQFDNQTTTVMEYGDSVFFLGKPKNSEIVGLYRIDGTTITKVSTVEMDKVFTARPKRYGITGVISMHGMNHVVVHAPNGNSNFGYTFSDTTYCYCIETKYWWQFQSTTSGATEGEFLLSCIASFNTSLSTRRGSQTVYGTFNSGTPTYGDTVAPNAYTMRVVVGDLDYDTSKRKFFTRADLIADQQSTTGTLSLTWADDAAGTYATGISLDTSGMKRAARLGFTSHKNSQRRSWKLEENIVRPFRGTRLDVYYELSEI